MIKEYKLINSNGISVVIISCGGIIKEINTPSSNGKIENIVLGYKDNNEFYFTISSNSFGVLICGKYSLNSISFKFSSEKEALSAVYKTLHILPFLESEI